MYKTDDLIKPLQIAKPEAVYFFTKLRKIIN